VSRVRIEEIEVFIGGDGEVQYEVRGVKGKKCLDLTKDLEGDLGDNILLREKTSEMREQSDRQEQQIDKTVANRI
jgi:hypothetical protein